MYFKNTYQVALCFFALFALEGFSLPDDDEIQKVDKSKSRKKHVTFDIPVVDQGEKMKEGYGPSSPHPCASLSDHAELAKLAKEYEYDGDVRTAISCYDRAIKIEGNIASYYRARAGLYFQRYQMELAAQDCEKVLELGTDDLPDYFVYGLILRELKNYHLAMEKMEMGLKIAEEKSPEINERRIISDMLQGVCEEVVKTDPDNVKGRFLLGRTLLFDGDYDKAIKNLEMALQFAREKNVSIDVIEDIANTLEKAREKKEDTKGPLYEVD